MYDRVYIAEVVFKHEEGYKHIIVRTNSHFWVGRNANEQSNPSSRISCKMNSSLEFQFIQSRISLISLKSSVKELVFLLTLLSLPKKSKNKFERVLIKKTIVCCWD